MVAEAFLDLANGEFRNEQVLIFLATREKNCQKHHFKFPGASWCKISLLDALSLEITFMCTTLFLCFSEIRNVSAPIMVKMGVEIRPVHVH